MRTSDLLLDAYDRTPPLIHEVVSGLDVAALCQRPAPGANTIAWLVWHLTRVHDDHLAEVMGTEQVWVRDSWAPRFSLPADTTETGYGHSPTEVAAVRPESAAALVEYFEATYAVTRPWLADLDDDALDRVVDTRWDPPVTLGARLVSVVDDAAQHVGQAAFVRGLLDR